MSSRTAWWRQWHRWIAFPASVFILFAAVTGILTAFTEFFGEEETIRERTRQLVSPVTLAAPAAAWSEPIGRALAAARETAGDAPIDKVTIEFKGDAPRVMVFTGKPEGGEDRKFVIDEKTGRLLANETYADKPLLYRIHSGEFLGDGGLVVAMGWGLALAFVGLSGVVIYLRILLRPRTPEPVGLKRFFW
ncbi:MAG: PepSY domain-containing protein [Gemmatimonadaceae bacterium]|nr:PepSY domain-containing protein [Gemmatimonadaceae bacterium]